LTQEPKKGIDVQVVKHIADVEKHKYTVVFKNVSETVELKLTSGDDGILQAYPTESTFTLNIDPWRQRKL
jgi:hypothetical protein